MNLQSVAPMPPETNPPPVDVHQTLSDLAYLVAALAVALKTDAIDQARGGDSFTLDDFKDMGTQLGHVGRQVQVAADQRLPYCDCGDWFATSAHRLRGICTGCAMDAADRAAGIGGGR